LVISYQHFEAAYCSHLQGSESLKVRSIGCPKTSVTNYQTMLCNIPEEQRPHCSSSTSLLQRLVFTTQASGFP